LRYPYIKIHVYFWSTANEINLCYALSCKSEWLKITVQQLKSKNTPSLNTRDITNC